MRIALAETLTLQTLPSTTARTFCILGLNFLLVIPVVFRPTPPKYLALPRRAILRPARVFLPVKKQTLDIFTIPTKPLSQFQWNLESIRLRPMISSVKFGKIKIPVSAIPVSQFHLDTCFNSAKLPIGDRKKELEVGNVNNGLINHASAVIVHLK
jgi:hypothetical protein